MRLWRPLHRGTRLLITCPETAHAMPSRWLPTARPALNGFPQRICPATTAGLSSTPDENGFFTYTRPEGKSGGHGVGWSEIPRYAFKVPAGWDETPVSIADLGGTEVRRWLAAFTPSAAIHPFALLLSRLAARLLTGYGFLQLADRPALRQQGRRQPCGGGGAGAAVHGCR